MLTNSQQQTAFKVGVGVFNMALHGSYMQVYADFLQQGGTEQSIYDVALSLPWAKTIYPDYFTSQQFAVKLVNNLVSTYASDNAKTAIVDAVASLLDQGQSKGTVAKLLSDALTTVSPQDTTWGPAASQYQNKLKVAEYVALNIPSTSDDAVRNVLKNVTSTTDLSTTQKIQTWVQSEQIDRTPKTLTLTTATDSLLGGQGNDIFTSDNSSGSMTLNVFDNLDGLGGTDLLKITDTSDTAFNLSASTGLANIEQLSLQHSANDGTDTISLNVSHLNSLRSIAIQTGGAPTNTTIQTRQNVDTVTIKNSGMLTITDQGMTDTLQSVSLENVQGNVTIASDALNTVTSTDSNMHLTLNSSGISTALHALSAIQQWTVVANGQTNLGIDLTQSSSIEQLLTLQGASLKSIALEGQANVTLTASGSAIESLNASLLTGHLTWTSGNLAASLSGVSSKGGSTIDTSGAQGVTTWRGVEGNDEIAANNGFNNIINAGDGNNKVRTGNGNDTITVGNGDSRVDSGTGLDLIQFGTGNHMYIQAINGSSATYATLSGVDSGDKIDLPGMANTSFVSAPVSLAATALFQDYLNAAAAGVSDRISWFVFENNTYVVTDRSAATTFQSNDQLIKLTGVLDLSVSSLDSVTSVLTL